MMTFTIGITKELHPFGSASRRIIQNFLLKHGFHTYLPQCALLRSADLTKQYEPGRGLVWTDWAFAIVSSFSRPMIAHFSDYWLEYGNNELSQRWRWRTARNHYVVIETATDSELDEFWSDIRRSLQQRGIMRPWIFIDEPPASARYGYNPAVLTRVTKLVSSLVRTNWTVGVAVPGPKQFSFWRQRIQPNLWILNAKHDRNVYGILPDDAEIWLYNRNSKRGGRTMQGLCAQLIEFNATGYLHWSFDSDIGTLPLGFYRPDAGPQWTAEGLQFVREIERCRRGKNG